MQGFPEGGIYKERICYEKLFSIFCGRFGNVLRDRVS